MGKKLNRGRDRMETAFLCCWKRIDFNPLGEQQRPPVFLDHHGDTRAHQYLGQKVLLEMKAQAKLEHCSVSSSCEFCKCRTAPVIILSHFLFGYVISLCCAKVPNPLFGSAEFTLPHLLCVLCISFLLYLQFGFT